MKIKNKWWVSYKIRQISKARERAMVNPATVKQLCFIAFLLEFTIVNAEEAKTIKNMIHNGVDFYWASKTIKYLQQKPYRFTFAEYKVKNSQWDYANRRWF
jgi:hypothetical protein